jgi:hypothetical protein
MNERSLKKSFYALMPAAMIFVINKSSTDKIVMLATRQDIEYNYFV